MGFSEFGVAPSDKLEVLVVPGSFGVPCDD
jgi:hypothetical protein